MSRRTDRAPRRGMRRLRADGADPFWGFCASMRMRARAFIMPARMFQTRQKLTTPGSGERRDGRGSGMSKVFEVARREFVATVFTKAFIIGLLVLPAMIAFFVLIGPRLFNADGFTVEGELAVIDATGEVMPELRAGLTEGTETADVFELIRRTRAEAA